VWQLLNNEYDDDDDCLGLGLLGLEDQVFIVLLFEDHCLDLCLLEYSPASEVILSSAATLTMLNDALQIKSSSLLMVT